MSNDSLFIEQAEYLPRKDFIEWSSDHPNESFILKKLTQSGAKLLTGPRGCGKTTLMLKAYNKLSIKGARGAFPIYVNFKASLKLEPIYKSKSNGGYWFSQWMYLKLYEGLYKSLDNFSALNDLKLKKDRKSIEKQISLLELGELDKVESNDWELTPYDLEDEIKEALLATGKSRCVLLLDDAAHAFSPEQQIDFFEFFRKIKSIVISPKAAIYPGVTNFAPTFNIGHDAEEIDAWVDPEDDDYYSFMNMMLSKRLPQEVYDQLLKDPHLLEIITYSAFGIPRVLLNMIRNIYVENDHENHVVTYDVKFKRRNVLKQVKESYKSTLSIFNSLEQKIPTYKNYITEGLMIYNKIIELIKIYNKEQNIEKKSITIAIKKEIDADLKKIFGFFQYAGLASHKGQLSKGEKGVFELFTLNLSALVDNNAILATQAFKTEDLANSLKRRNAHAYTRTQSEYLLSNIESSIKLSMPPCSICKAERTSEEARFCSNCGSPLKSSSIYDSLINEKIDVLGLTKTRVASIDEYSSIRTVRDVIHDIGHRELKRVPQIGKYWASKIYYLAEEYIS